MGGYAAREVAKMLGLSLGEVRAYVRAGFLEPTRGARGELRFSFQDLVLLRTAQGLVSARIAPRRVRSALRKLKEQLPEGRPLRGVHIRAVGDRIVVGDGRASWSPESGQVLFDFETQELARMVATPPTGTSAPATWKRPRRTRRAMRTGARWRWILRSGTRGSISAVCSTKR